MSYEMTFLGRPMEYWVQFDHVMHKHGVNDANQLDQRLQNNKRVEVYDQLNTGRLLGTLPKPNLDGPHVRVPTFNNVSVCDFQPNAPLEMTLTTVSLEAQIKRTGYLDAKGVLVTNDSLKDLMKVRDFRLPGESAEQAERRRYNY